VFDQFRKDKELRSIPICIITGKPELRKLIYEHPDSPPNGYIDKPISEKELILNLKRILEVGHKVQST
jgi:CheY-like chemotaxis protein